MSKPRVVFRADGNAQIGLGHISRSLALAEMLSPEFNCVFAIVHPPENTLSLLGSAFQVIRLPELELAQELEFLASEVLQPTDIVVLDGYQFDLNYQQKIKALSCKLVFIDDLNAQPFVADAVTNHAPGLSGNSYKTEANTHLCLGFEYALLRHPFLRAARELNSRKLPVYRDRAHVLITFGGADKYNLCEKITRMCLAIPAVEKISVVLGSGSNRQAFEAGFAGGRPVKAYTNLSAEEMCSLMLKCGVLLAPASTVVMEGLATFLPVLCGYYVPAQLPPYQQLVAARCITPVGDWNLVTETDIEFALSNLPEKPVSVIDGQQPERFRKLFRSLRKQTMP